MPYVNVKITRGPEVTREKKAAIVAGITQLLVETLGKNPATTHVLIEEVETDNWGIAGQLVTDIRAAQKTA